MIITFFSSVFAGIGFAVALIGIVRGSFFLVDTIQAKHKRKRDREDQIITTLNRIENHLNHPKP